MISSLYYPINTIVIGQCPYENNLIPELGSAFSQLEGTRDTPTTTIFSKHFEDEVVLKDFIRSTWKLLPRGYLFINTDYAPI